MLGCSEEKSDKATGKTDNKGIPDSVVTSRFSFCFDDLIKVIGLFIHESSKPLIQVVYEIRESLKNADQISSGAKTMCGR